MSTTTKQSPVRPSQAAVAEAKQLQLQFVPVNVSAIELGKVPELKQGFRVDEAATFFGVSNSQVRNWIDSGDLAGWQVSNPARPHERTHLRITRESMVKLWNDQRRKV